jgi:hypothetical protein
MNIEITIGRKEDGRCPIRHLDCRLEHPALFEHTVNLQGCQVPAIVDNYVNFSAASCKRRLQGLHLQAF